MKSSGSYGLHNQAEGKFSFVKKAGLILGPILFILILLLRIEGLSPEGKSILAGTAWIVVWWITEAIPLAVTSLLPVILFPLTGGMDISSTTTTYMSPMIMLFMGGFIIALAMEKWNLHQRIALSIISFIGTNAVSIILGFMIATMFLSMWISNTATALMMLPIGLAIAKKISDLEVIATKASRFEKSLMLAIAYGASIGGMATLIGTPTNAIFAAMSLELFEVEITFSQWIALGLPISLVLLVIGWLYLTRIAFPTRISESGTAREEIRKQLKTLGKTSREERLVMVIFVCTALAWILRSFLLERILPGIHDTIIAMAGAIILFLVPASKGKGMLMDWKTARKLPWGILLLFGGGLSIAIGFKTSGLAEWLGGHLGNLDHLPYYLILLLTLFLVNFSTEITSNVATASVLLPILALLSESLGVAPWGLMVGASLAASCAFMLPVATPPNAIAYSSGFLSMRDMVRIGFWMNLISTTLLYLCIRYLMPLLWNIDMNAGNHAV